MKKPSSTKFNAAAYRKSIEALSLSELREALVREAELRFIAGTEGATRPMSEDEIGTSINDGRRDVVIALLEVLGRMQDAALIQEIADDPYIGLRDLFASTPVPIILFCPKCGGRHVDEGEFATRVHRTHSCQYCGLQWAPALVPTVGVQFLPGCKNKEKTS